MATNPPARREPDPPGHPGEPTTHVLDVADSYLARHRVRPGAFPFLGDGVERTLSLTEEFARLIAVSVARAEFLGQLLAEQYASAQAAQDRSPTRTYATPWDTDTKLGEPGAAPDEWDDPDDGDAVGLGGPRGAAGIIGYTYASAVVGPPQETSMERIATGEAVRALVDLESKERDRAAALLEKAARLNLDLHKVELMRGYAATVSAALRTFSGELGLDPRDQRVLHVQKRAALAARRAIGQDDGDPDRVIGPALSDADRGAVLAAALPAGYRLPPKPRAPRARRPRKPAAG